jgi:hypothetical protein
VPDLNGVLTGEEKSKIIDWLNSKVPPKSASVPYMVAEPQFSCQVCGGGRFGLSEHVVTPTVLNVNGIGLMSPSFPQVMLNCENCRTTIFISVAHLLNFNK